MIATRRDEGMSGPDAALDPDAALGGGAMGASALRVRQNWLLGLCALFFAIVYLCLWPHISTTMDESSYIGFAYVLRHGTLYADHVRAPILLALSVHGHLVSKYPLGMSALLAVTSFLGWQFALGTNLFVHLVSYSVVVRILRRLNVSPFYAILYLLHPTAVLYSRTVMSDLVSGLVLVLAFEQYLARRFTAMGALLGLAVLLRTANAVALPLFLVGVLIEQESGDLGLRVQDLAPRLRSAALTAGGSLPFLVLSAYYSLVVAGGQMAKSTGSFGLQYFPIYFPGYVLCLLLIFPGMLLAPALVRGRGRFVAWSLCYSFVVIYSFWYFRDQGGNAAESLIVGQRYFLAVLPIYIVCYGSLLERLAVRLPSAGLRRSAAVLALLVMAAVSVVVQIRHALKLKQMIGVRDAVITATSPDDFIYCNTQVGKLLEPWSNRQFVEPVDSGVADIMTINKWIARSRPGPVPAASNLRPRLVFASWVRAGRSDDQEDGQRISTLEKRFTTAPIASPSAPDLHLRYIIEVPGKDRLMDSFAKPHIGLAP